MSVRLEKGASSADQPAVRMSADQPAVRMTAKVELLAFFFLRGEKKQSQENEKVSFCFEERLCAERRFPRSAHRCAATPLFFFSLRYGSIGPRLAHYLTRGVHIQLAKHPLCGHLRSKTKSNFNCWALKIQDSNIIKSLHFYSTLAIL